MVTVGGEGRATACVAEWEEAVARGGKEAWRQVVEGSRWRDERNGEENFFAPPVTSRIVG